MRTVLLATYHFPPSSAVAVHRMLGLVRYLPEYGWQPVVVAPPPLAWEPQDGALLDKVPPGTPVYRVPFRQGGLWNRFAAKFLPLLRWYPDARRACLRAALEHRPAALITSSPPGCVHYLGLKLKRRLRLPWIACLRDPWVVNWRRPLPWSKWCETPMEARVMRRADVIIANTPGNLHGLQAAYPAQAGKMDFILNGFDPEPFEGLPGPSLDAKRVTLLHAGELYAGRDPRPLLDVLHDLRVNPVPGLPRLELEFLGSSTEGIYDLPREVAARGLADTVCITPHVPYAESLRRMCQAGILLLLSSPGFKVGIPAKLYEYLGARRPILALADQPSDVSWILQRSGAPHRTASFDNRGDIRAALLGLVQETLAGAAAHDMQRLETFTRRAMARRFATHLDALTAGARAPRRSQAPALV